MASADKPAVLTQVRRRCAAGTALIAMQPPPVVLHLTTVWGFVEPWLQPGEPPCSHWSAPRCVWNSWHGEAIHFFVIRTSSTFRWVSQHWQDSSKEEVQDRRWQLESYSFEAGHRSDPNWSDDHNDGYYGGYDSGASS